jgi:DNA-binding MarR family transcriptional regulator
MRRGANGDLARQQGALPAARVVWRNYHQQNVPSSGLCGTTIVMEGSNGDGELERLLIELLRAVAPTASGNTAGPAQDFRVSASEGRALVQLLAARGIAQGELAGLLGLEKSTVSRLAVGLQQKGWIERGRDEGNQRYVRLYLTPSGSEIAVRLLQAWQSKQARIIASLTDAERAGLAAGVGGLLRGLIAEGILGGTGPGHPDDAKVKS